MDYQHSALPESASVKDRLGLNQFFAFKFLRSGLLDAVLKLKIISMSFFSLLVMQGNSWANVSPLQRPAVDVAWFRSEDWSLEIACSVNGCSVSNSIVREGHQGFSTEFYSDRLSSDQCVIDLQKQESRCQADHVDLIIGFNQVPGGSLSVVKFDDTAIVEAKDALGNVIYYSRKNFPFEGCAFRVPENGAYVGTFGSTNFRPFETIILADGTNKSACDDRPIKNPVKITGTLKKREIQCVSREFAFSLNVGEPEANPSIGGGPYIYFSQNIAFEIRARNEQAAVQLGKVLDRPTERFSIVTSQGKMVYYDTSYGISVLEPNEADPFGIYPSKWMGDFSGMQLPVIIEANSDGSFFNVHLQNAYEGAEAYVSDLQFPISNCTAN